MSEISEGDWLEGRYPDAEREDYERRVVARSVANPLWEGDWCLNHRREAEDVPDSDGHTVCAAGAGEQEANPCRIVPVRVVPNPEDTTPNPE